MIGEGERERERERDSTFPASTGSEAELVM